MAAVVIGIVIGLALVFPIAELIRFFFAELTGWYGDMTLPEAFQAIIVILLTVLLARSFHNGVPGETRGPGPVIGPPPRPPREPREERVRERTNRSTSSTRSRRASGADEDRERSPSRRSSRSASKRRTTSRRRVDTDEQEDDAPRSRRSSRRKSSRRSRS